MFYLSFLPAFVDLSTLTAGNVAVIVSAAILAVGGVKLAYAYGADKAGQVIGSKLSEHVNALAAVTMFAAGIWVTVRA